MPPPTPLRRDLLLAFGVLFAGAVLLAGAGLAVLLPVLESPAEAVLFVVTLVVADLVVLFLFGGATLRRRLVRPMERLASDLARIAQGDYGHRIAPFDSLELERIRECVNAMADRLTADQRQLADNVRSLERTNRELVVARDQVVRTARLASVGTLAAGIAHEVGNPLSAVMAFVDVARARAAESGGETELLDSIRAEAGRIDRIVRGLLDYARPRAEEAGPVDPGEVLAGVRDLLEGQGKLDGMRHTWTIEDDVPPVVMEPHRLEQVLVNLVLNALDALDGVERPRIDVYLSVEPGGVARLPVRREDDPEDVDYRHRRRVSRDGGPAGVDSLFTARHVVTIEVSDNGPGIREEDRQVVFDPFYTTKDPGRGTGLGLAICARLVEGMGGRIDVSGNEDGGASFRIRLPGYTEEVER